MHVILNPIAKKIKEASQNAMISPQCLEFEIPEGAIMRNPEKAIRTLTELNTMWIRFSIDDFGMGYSSPSHLKRLPLLDFLKIDQAIVRAIIAMARCCI